MWSLGFSFMLLKAEWKHYLFDDFLKPKPIELLVLFSVIFLELTLGKINPQLPILLETSFCKVTSYPKNSSKRKMIFTGSLCSQKKKPIRKSCLSSPGRIHWLKFTINRTNQNEWQKIIFLNSNIHILPFGDCIQ